MKPGKQVNMDIMYLYIKEKNVYPQFIKASTQWNGNKKLFCKLCATESSYSKYQQANRCHIMLKYNRYKKL